MTKRENDSLTCLLRRWLDEALPSDDDQVQLERVLRRAAELPQPQSPARSRPSRRKYGATVWLSAGAAATVLALLAAWMLKTSSGTIQPPALRREHAERREDQTPARNDRRPDVQPLRPDGPPADTALVQLGSDELRRRWDLLDQLDELFGKRWVWMVECGDRVDMKVTCNSISPDSAPLAARLAILTRQGPDQEFRVHDKSFILTREQQLVEAVFEDGAARKLSFWVYAIDESLYTYDLDFVLEGEQSLSISTSGVLVAGRATQIFSIRRGQHEYRAVLLLMSRLRTASPNSKRTL